jgi:MFS family permease
MRTLDRPALRAAGTGKLFSSSFVALSLATACFATAHFFFFPALPLYFERLGGTDAQIGLVFGAASLAALLSRPFIGGFVQRWGAKAIFTVGIALVPLAAGGFMLATVFVGILFTRMLVGLYQAMTSTAGATYVADVAPLGRRGTAIGIYGTATMAGQLVGGPFAIWLLDNGAFRGTEAGLAGLLGRAPHNQNFYSLFALAAMVGAVAVVFTRFMAPVGFGARGEAGWRWRGLFNRQALLPAIVSLCQTVNTISVFSFLPLMARRLDLGNFGLFFTLSALALIVVRFVSGPVSDRYGRVVVILPGMALMLLGAVLLAFTADYLGLYAAAIAWGLGNGAAQPGLQAYVVDRIPPEVRGTAMSTFTLGSDLGLGLGATLLGIVLQLSNFTLTYLTSAAVILVGMVIFALGHARGWTGQVTSDE